MAAAATRDITAIHAELGNEHRRVMALVERLRAHRELAGLVPLLSELHEVLVHHFSHEQFPGGLYECMGAYGVEHHEDIKVLVREHCLILSAVRSLLERARLAEPGAEGPLLVEAGELVEQIEGHERREHALAEKLVRGAG